MYKILSMLSDYNSVASVHISVFSLKISLLFYLLGSINGKDLDF